jgi:hypothetical protein
MNSSDIYSKKDLTPLPAFAPLGKEITDNLPTIEVDGTALDLFSNVEPLTQGADVVGSLLEFLATLEYRKMAKRDKLSLYMWGDDENWGMFRQILEMIGGQHPFEQSVSGDRESDLAVLKDEIKNFAADLDLLCGVTKVDRRFIANDADEQFPYDTAIMLGKAMDRDLIEEIPDPQEKLWDFETSSNLENGFLIAPSLSGPKGTGRLHGQPLTEP